MENIKNDKLLKILTAWVVGMICLPGVSYLGGAVIASLAFAEWLKMIAVLFFLIGSYFFWPCLAFTGFVAVACGLASQSVKKAAINSALINLGIVFFLALLFGGVFPIGR